MVASGTACLEKYKYGNSENFNYDKYHYVISLNLDFRLKMTHKYIKIIDSFVKTNYFLRYFCYVEEEAMKTKRNNCKNGQK